MSYPYVEVNIFEEEIFPVVMHRFYGKTIKEAYGYLKSHMKSDKFLYAAMRVGNWKGIPLHYTYKESK